MEEVQEGGIEKDRLFHPISSIPSVKVKAEWAQRYMLETLPFATRLVAFACVEGVLFSSSFAAVFYFKSKRKLPGLCLSNEFIARDEGMHTEFACLLLSRLNNRPADRVANHGQASHPGRSVGCTTCSSSSSSPSPRAQAAQHPAQHPATKSSSPHHHHRVLSAYPPAREALARGSDPSLRV